MGVLFYLTFIVNFLGLMWAVWLGIYLVTRNSRSLPAWATALTLWSMATYFINVLLAINPPPHLPYWPSWMRFLFPFWPEGAVQGDGNEWLQGWATIPAIVFWQHASILLLPGRLTLWRWARILGGYAMAAVAVVVQTREGILLSIPSVDPLYINSMRPGAMYPLMEGILVVVTVSIAYNLVRARAAAPAAISRRQLVYLVGATLVSGLIGLVLMACFYLKLTVPIVFLSLVYLATTGLIGISVGEYSAFMAGRTMRRDFFYNFILLGVMVMFYLLVSWLLVWAYQAPSVLLVFVPLLAVVSYFVTYVSSRLFDTLYFRGADRHFRASLRQLSRQAMEGRQIEDHLAEAMDTLCESHNASFGLIFTFEGEKACLSAACHWRGGAVEIRSAALAVDDVVFLTPGRFPPPLADACLIIPLYGEYQQLGALVLGAPNNGLQFAPGEVEDLLARSDQIANVLYIARLKANYMRQIVEMDENQHQPAGRSAASVPAAVVETALRNLSDYAFLADSPLAELEIVRLRLPASGVSHLERGKMVHSILLDALEKLCPQTKLPHDPPPREWHPYLILREAYCDEKPNRDIMSRLYISEGTFNRTRRSAIRSIARVLGEMEVSPT